MNAAEKPYAALNALEKSCGYLADARKAEESGNKELAEKLFAKSETWLVRYNNLTGG